MTDQDQFTTFFREIQVKFSRIYAQLLSKADVSLPQYALLSQLVSTGIIPMSEASKRLHLSKPAITNLVDRLEQKKLLKRLPHSKDRRIYLLQVQERGEKLVRQIQSQVLKFVLATLNKFKESEKKVIVRFYSLLLKNVGEFLIQKK